MVKTIFLIAAFSGHGASTTTTISTMPDMKTCKAAEQALYDFSERTHCGFLNCEGVNVQKPIKTKCEER